MTKIYEIWSDAQHYGDEDYDGVYRGDDYSIPYSFCEQSQQRLGKAPMEMPRTFDFDTDNAERLQEINIALHSGSPLDIFSEKLISIITSAGNVDWTLIPTRYFDASTKLEICAGKFNAVFFEDFCDCFDYELSEYQLGSPDHSSERVRKEVIAVKKWALKEPENGFPPYFRLLADASLKLVNEETHDAIVAAGISGIEMSLIGDF